jgi:hypothetical protein
MIYTRNLMLALALASALAACGGGDDAPPAADPLAEVPGEATQSATGLVAYLSTLAQLASEAREAIDLTALAALFTSDTTEPEPVQ